MVVKTSSMQGSRRKSSAGTIGMIMIALSIVCASLILSRTNTQSTQSVEVPQYVAQYDVIEVPVPAQKVLAGTKISQIVFKNISFPRHQLPAGALISLEGLSESVTTSSLPANLPLFKENLSQSAVSSNPVIERIPQGMRAMTVRVDATTAVEGWAGSGAIVDVLLIEKNRTSVVAESVKILSAERNVSAVEGAASPNVPSTVTLLVTQEQCLAINTAIPLGRIAFALRGGRDKEGWNQSVFTAENLKGISSSEAGSNGSVNGYVSVREGAQNKAFALSQGRWVKTEVVPDGFLVNSKR